MDPRPVHALAVDRHPAERVALIEHGRRAWTFGELAEASRRMAHALRHEERIAPGDRVAVVLGQRAEAAILHLACSRIGALSVPLSPLFGQEGLASRMGDAGAKLVLTSDDKAHAMPAGVRVRTLERRRWQDAPELARAEETRAGGDAPLWLVYTSGTTGGPKGALLPHRVLEGRMSGFRLAHEPMDDTSVFFSPADWSWIGGLLDSLFAPWCDGHAAVAQERRGAFDAAEAYRAMREHAVTDAFLPPTALKALARAAMEPPVRLRAVHSAGEPLPAPTAAWARERLAEHVTEVYGLTEAAFLIGTATRAYATPPGSMGRPYPTHLVELAEDGEICVRRGDPTMMLGYWRGEHAAPHLPLDERGLLHTGDLAREEDGFLFFLGRKDDLIKTSGIRVGPAEVEAALLRHAAVAECAVVGVPDEARGQRIKAFVKRATPVEAEELMRFVRERLAAHAYPREIEFVDELPMTVSGKLRRRELRGR